MNPTGELAQKAAQPAKESQPENRYAHESLAALGWHEEPWCDYIKELHCLLEGIDLFGCQEVRSFDTESGHGSYAERCRELRQNFNDGKIIRYGLFDPEYDESYGNHRWLVIKIWFDRGNGDHAIIQGAIYDGGMKRFKQWYIPGSAPNRKLRHQQINTTYQYIENQYVPVKEDVILDNS